MTWKYEEWEFLVFEFCFIKKQFEEVHYILQKRMKTIIGIFYFFTWKIMQAIKYSPLVFWQAMRLISEKDYIWDLSTWLFFGQQPRGGPLFFKITGIN